MDFEWFYENTKALVYQYLQHHVQAASELEDIVQEVYVIALEEWEILKKHPNPTGWLMVTAKNLVKGYHRRYYRTEYIDEQPEKEIPYEEPAFNMLVMEDFLESVYGAKESELAKRYFLEKESVETLSKELGVTEGNMRTRLYRMRRRLKYYVEQGEKVW